MLSIFRKIVNYGIVYNEIMIFDGKSFAAKIEEELRLKVAGMDRKPRLAVLLDPKNEAGAKYVEQKRKFGQRIGVEVEVHQFPSFSVSQFDQLVGDGIMIQLPYPNSKALIDLIDLKKDVDGLRQNSPFKSATVRAVLEILKCTGSFTSVQDDNVVIVGSMGEVGKRLISEFPGAIGMDKEDFDPEKLKKADAIVSATGQAGLIKPEMVKEGVACIDVGFPKGDFEPDVASKASFFTPVPGGVGPVTVAMLFKNLIEGVK